MAYVHRICNVPVCEYDGRAGLLYLYIFWNASKMLMDDIVGYSTFTPRIFTILKQRYKSCKLKMSLIKLGATTA